eukprot:1141039-Pelagomonas_calceolata.AAC.3
MSVNPLVAEHIPHSYPGKHGAEHECGTASLYASAKLPSYADDKVCWDAWSKCKGVGKTRTDSYAKHIFGLTGGREQEVISKGHAAQGVSDVGVSVILVWDAAVQVPMAAYVEPSKKWFHIEHEEKGRECITLDCPPLNRCLIQGLRA